MRVGISIGSAFVADGPGGSRQGPASVLAQARAAVRGGLDFLTLGDHHATGPFGYVQNVPMIGRLAAEWTERQLGCLFLMPLWHPVLLAEQVGTLAAMASGPFIVQTGLGEGEGQFQAMGVDLAERAVRLEEGVRVAQALLHGETVDSARLGVKGARIAPLPPDGTEWWIGGGARKAIDRAARLGDCWYGNADLTPETARRDIDVYREACALHDRVPSRAPVRKDVFIAESVAEGERVGDAIMAGGYRGFERAAVAYGDPESVAEQLAPFAEMGFTDVVIRTMGPLPPGTDPAASDRTVELAGEVRSLLA
jgi:alkanesulfonate monooxygenase SsuD/methylene tetrahydromethanopterin reductase-like flavin-dependent oxidoreductase (luciferase family)